MKTTKKKSRALLLCICIAMLGIFTGCSSNPKNFTSGNITITLTEAFSESKMKGFDAYIVSDDITFSAKEEKISDLELAGYEITDLKGYALEICNLNMMKSSDLKQRNSYYYFVNSDTVNGAKYTYVHCMFKTKSSYWICEFVCKSKNYDKFEKKIFEWADTITIQ